MIPGKGSRMRDHVSEPVKGLKALKSSIFFGANASGKSNIFMAIMTGKRMVCSELGNKKALPYHPFLLNGQEEVQTSTRMEYEFQINGNNYAYGFVYNATHILEEWLYKVTSRSDKMIYTRDTSKKTAFDITPLQSMVRRGDDKMLLTVAARTCKEDTLFLSTLYHMGVLKELPKLEDINNTLKWFHYTLTVLAPGQPYHQSSLINLINNKDLKARYDMLLKFFDTDISSVHFKPVKSGNDFGFSQELNNELTKRLESYEEMMSAMEGGIMCFNNIFIVSVKDKKQKVTHYKLQTVHMDNQGKEILFDTNLESDGTIRILELIPLLLDLLDGDKVVMIDEIGRSLHPKLTYAFIQHYLKSVSDKSSQLIITSHEVELLDQDLFRKDEFWFVNKNNFHETTINSLEEYDVRFDKNIRSAYLQGRFNGVPKLCMNS